MSKTEYNEPTTVDVKSESIQYADEPIQLEWTEEEEQVIKRKLDWHTVPLVTTLYLLCVCDFFLPSNINRLLHCH